MLRQQSNVARPRCLGMIRGTLTGEAHDRGVGENSGILEALQRGVDEHEQVDESLVTHLMDHLNRQPPTRPREELADGMELAFPALAKREVDEHDWGRYRGAFCLVSRVQAAAAMRDAFHSAPLLGGLAVTHSWGHCGTLNSGWSSDASSGGVADAISRSVCS